MISFLLLNAEIVVNGERGSGSVLFVFPVFAAASVPAEKFPLSLPKRDRGCRSGELYEAFRSQESRFLVL
jgi:hypothetical protein